MLLSHPITGWLTPSIDCAAAICKLDQVKLDIGRYNSKIEENNKDHSSLDALASTIASAKDRLDQQPAYTCLLQQEIFAFSAFRGL